MCMGVPLQLTACTNKVRGVISEFPAASADWLITAIPAMLDLD